MIQITSYVLHHRAVAGLGFQPFRVAAHLVIQFTCRGVVAENHGLEKNRLSRTGEPVIETQEHSGDLMLADCGLGHYAVGVGILEPSGPFENILARNRRLADENIFVTHTETL